MSLNSQVGETESLECKINLNKADVDTSAVGDEKYKSE
jgi:hypothetical protein